MVAKLLLDLAGHYILNFSHLHPQTGTTSDNLVIEAAEAFPRPSD